MKKQSFSANSIIKPEINKTILKYYNNIRNLYVYCSSNPIIYVDPTGMFEVYLKSLGRGMVKHVETGYVPNKELPRYGVQLSFKDPYKETAKMGVSLINAKAGIALAIGDIIDSIDKGDLKGGITDIIGLVDEEAGMAKDMIGIVEALYDYAIMSEFKGRYGNDSLSKIYSKPELMEKMGSVLEDLNIRNYELEEMINTADFEHWNERFVAKILGVYYDDWYEYEPFDPWELFENIW